MALKIDNILIKKDLDAILKRLNTETSGRLFKTRKPVGDNLATNCPIHKGGQESHPSFYIFKGDDNSKVTFGTGHCFTCGYNAPLFKIVADSLQIPDNSAKDWLKDNFGEYMVTEELLLPPISLNKTTPRSSDLDEAVLKKFDFYHPYMWERKLSKSVIDQFHVGYDQEMDALTFPVWDDLGKLKFISRRSVTGKKFMIQKNLDKPVYLLNYIKRWGITDVYVTESQINCLYLWSLGYPSIALLGTGSMAQYAILRRSGIRHYILCLDGDEAGDRGIDRFIQNIKSDCLISIKRLPRGKDCNDLSKEEFENLQIS